MPTVERNLSDMLRSSGEVLREAESQDVVLRRRDGADVMLVDFEREQALRRSLADAARIIAYARYGDEVLGARLMESLPDALPWTQSLPEEERLTFLREFTTTAAACLETGVFEPMAQLSTEWRETAAIHADPRLLAALRAPSEGDLGPVATPGRSGVASAK
jgi:hypothetical protein